MLLHVFLFIQAHTACMGAREGVQPHVGHVLVRMDSVHAACCLARSSKPHKPPPMWMTAGVVPIFACNVMFRRGVLNRRGAQGCFCVDCLFWPHLRCG